MLAALENLPRGEFKTLLRELAAITFRYNLGDLNPNEAERIFSKVANEIAKKQLVTVKEVVLSLKSIYVSDDNFEQAFSTVIINTRRKKELVKYILVSIENQIANKDYQPEDAVSTIEHILPENPGSLWDDKFPVDIQDDYIFRLGNYSLLEKGINNRLGSNLPFASKLDEYRKSSYLLSSKWCNYDDFSPKEIALRQEKMAQVAKGIWRSAYINSLV
jgi:hypothetical protein